MYIHKLKALTCYCGVIDPPALGERRLCRSRGHQLAPNRAALQAINICRRKTATFSLDGTVQSKTSGHHSIYFPQLTSLGSIT